MLANRYRVLQHVVSQVILNTKQGALLEELLRGNPPEVRVTSGQNSSTKIIYIVLQTSVGLF